MSRLQVLDEQECRQLLEESTVGWLAHCAEGRVHMVPVNFTVNNDEIVVSCGYGASLQAAANGHLMTFAASRLDATDYTGWSVTVVGDAHMVGDGLVNPGLRPAEVWPELRRTVSIAIPMSEVTGRRMLAESEDAVFHGHA